MFFFLDTPMSQKVFVGKSSLACMRGGTVLHTKSSQMQSPDTHESLRVLYATEEIQLS